MQKTKTDFITFETNLVKPAKKLFNFNISLKFNF